MRCDAGATVLTVTPEPLTVDPNHVTAGEPICNVSLSRAGGFTGFIAYDVTVKNDVDNVTNQVVFAGKFAGDTARADNGWQRTATLHLLERDPDTDVQHRPVAARPTRSAASRPFCAGLPDADRGHAARLHLDHDLLERRQFQFDAVDHNDTNGTTYAKLITATSPDVATSFNTYVPVGTFTFFTGTTGKASLTNSNQWTTTVTIPATDPTTANVAQSQDQQSCSPDLLTCNVSTLTIPGQFASLTITLRRDASTIKSGAKIQNAVITTRRFRSASPATIPTTFRFAPTCPEACHIGQSMHGCAKAYTKKNTSDPEFLGDWEFVIHALDNGSYRG